MALTEITPTWQDKQAKAKELTTEVKRLHAEGINDGDTATKAHNMMAEAQRIMGEAKAEKLAEDNQRLADLLSDFEDAATKSIAKGEDMSGTKAALAQLRNGPLVIDVPDEPDLNAQYAKRFADRIVATERMASMLGFKDFSTKAQDISPDVLREMQQKALAEGTGNASFLVPPQFLQNLFAETRRQGNALRRYGWLTEHPVNSNQVLIPRGSGAATVGIVAENATKPSADQTYTQIVIDIFTWAGISKVSNQLMADSNPTAADLVNRELGTLLGNLEEQKIINGSGTGEPRGILNTTGTGAIAAATNTGQAIIDAIIDGIASVQQNYFAPPNGILLHPRRLAFIQKSKDTATNYLFNGNGAFRSPGSMTLNGVTSQSEGTTANMPTLLGLPVGQSANLPTNLGGGTNQDAIIVADWGQAHWFQRQDITMDVSREAGTAFETNQTWFRLEERAGFTAARYPAAFAVLTGTGLVP